MLFTVLNGRKLQREMATRLPSQSPELPGNANQLVSDKAAN
jgi:hypothetical protein